MTAMMAQLGVGGMGRNPAQEQPAPAPSGNQAAEGPSGGRHNQRTPPLTGDENPQNMEPPHCEPPPPLAANRGQDPPVEEVDKLTH